MTKPGDKNGRFLLSEMLSGAFLHDERPEDALKPYPRREILLGLGVTGLFVLGLLIWALFSRLDAAVYAPGQIVVSGNLQSVQHREGGIVSELDTHEGDQVRAGQVLLKLSSTEQDASEHALAAQVIELRALQARLRAEFNGQGSIQFPADFSSLTGADRAAADAAIALQQREFSTRRAALFTEKDVLSQRVKESREQIIGLQRQVVANKEQQRLIQEEIDSLKDLLDRGLVPLTRLRSLQRNAAELKGGEGEYDANIAKSEQEIGETRIRITTLDKERLADDGKDYRAAEFQLAELVPKLSAVRDQVARANIRAPSTGKVVGMSIFTVGGVVAPGQKLMDIVPTDEPLVTEARVKPTDVSDLRIGQQTEIRLTAFHNRNMPLIMGKISKISADSFTDEKTGVAYFKIEAVAPPSQLALISTIKGAQTTIKPGYPADIVIPLRRRSGLDYILEPLQTALWKSFREH